MSTGRFYKCLLLTYSDFSGIDFGNQIQTNDVINLKKNSQVFLGGGSYSLSATGTHSQSFHCVSGAPMWKPVGPPDSLRNNRGPQRPLRYGYSFKFIYLYILILEILKEKFKYANSFKMVINQCFGLY